MLILDFRCAFSSVPVDSRAVLVETVTIENRKRVIADRRQDRQPRSYQVRRLKTDAQMKVLQSAKIRELGHALATAGILTLDKQADTLGLSRSTTWTILKGKHKSSGLSAAIINRMLAGRQLPPQVRVKILEYVEEKAGGYYGHSETIRRRFIARLSTKWIGQKIVATGELGIANVAAAAAETYACSRPTARGSGRIKFGSKLKQPRSTRL
jgi:predicted DNA-binding transcriptional regulator AlpA